MEMYRWRHKAKQSDTSNTWWLFVCLCIFYFLFRWNLIYSTTTSWPCQTISEYWLTSDGYLPGIYELFLLAFILFAAWSVIEMLSAISANKSDKLVASVVNPLIILFLCYLFFFFAKQWEFFETQRDIRLHNEIFTKPKAYSYEAEELFHHFLAQQYCSGVIDRLYPVSDEERVALYGEFIEQGWVRPNSPIERQ